MTLRLTRYLTNVHNDDEGRNYESEFLMKTYRMDEATRDIICKKGVIGGFRESHPLYIQFMTLMEL